MGSLDQYFKEGITFKIYILKITLTAPTFASNLVYKINIDSAKQYPIAEYGLVSDPSGLPAGKI